MGEYADDEINRMIFGGTRVPVYHEPRVRSFQAGVGNFKWRRSGGEILNMEDMEDEYIANCIRICEETGNTGKKDQLEFILKRRQRQYLDNARMAETPAEKQERAFKTIGNSTQWPIPK